MASSNTGFTVQTNGQTLVVTATVNGATSTLYSDSAVTSSVSLPHTITSDTTYYLKPDNYGTQIVSVKQPDGSELWGKGLDCYQYTGIQVIAPLPTAAQVAADVSPSDADRLTTAGCWNIPRHSAMGGTTMSTGVLRASVFSAPRTMTVGAVAVATATTAAAATPSLIQVGVWSIAANGDADALIASTAHDAALLASTHTRYEKAFSATWDMVRGARYAIGLLVVTGATAPLVVAFGPLSNAQGGVAPISAFQRSAQAALPASVTAANMTATGAEVLFELVPA